MQFLSCTWIQGFRDKAAKKQVYHDSQVEREQSGETVQKTGLPTSHSWRSTQTDWHGQHLKNIRQWGRKAEYADYISLLLHNGEQQKKKNRWTGFWSIF